MKIRAITLFVDLTLPLQATPLREWSKFAQVAQRAFEDAGFPVQTTRLATHLFATQLPSMAETRSAKWAAALEAACQEHGFAFTALGVAQGEWAAALPEILAATQTLFASAHIVDPLHGTIDGRMIQQAAQVIHTAAAIENGFGNLRFAALANVLPGTPFFPAAYSRGGAPSFALATEAADLAVAACRAATSAAEAHERLAACLTAEAAQMTITAETVAQTHGWCFGGIDFSLAPFPGPDTSIGAALELLSGQPLGAAGTLAAAATLTSAIEQAVFPRAGFCGLMLPVLEDSILAQRAAEGRFSVGDLLQWSAVCGTGLDTVPLPGAVSVEALARLLWDVAALAVRQHKPLTARLMPLPGKVAGDPTHFDFAYFADGGVLSLNGGVEAGQLTGTVALPLMARGGRRNA
ncbi:MAG TPA: DUF711 family protein [Anaerolineae bacterium]|nr:DUF711 family protein [Anaerolineae bacterium]